MQFCEENKELNSSKQQLSDINDELNKLIKKLSNENQ